MRKSSSLEDYLKCIFELKKKKSVVRSIDIAEEMGVTKPSVSNAMKKLREQNMIYFGREGHIFFTDEGRTVAENIYNKHSILSKLLTIVGVDKDIADTPHRR
ncbi:MAG: metal-dependent transcriptional regulator [Lachnospiraceae bacterium]|nr:metal-dependent transcriptional regulator [Lachnospiraceae bacterium]